MAGYASQQSGVSSDLLKKMLPMLATAAMGALAKQTTGGSSTQGLAVDRQAGTGLDLLESFLDSDRDGSMIDDVLGMAQKFF